MRLNKIGGKTKKRFGGWDEQLTKLFHRFLLLIHKISDFFV